MRGILSAVLLASATLAVPAAPAASPQHTAYEVVLHRFHGAQKAEVTVTGSTDGGPSALVFMELERSKRGHDVRSMGISLSRGGSDGYQAYGWPVAAPPCPSSCKPAYTPRSTGFGVQVTPTIGTRYIIAGVRAKLRVTVSDKAHWQVRPINLGVRTVLGKDAAATGLSWQGSAVEHFTKASAPGGRYGSAVFGQVPCYTFGAGSATLKADNGDEGWGINCEGVLPWDSDFASTNAGRRWTLEGTVVGDYVFPYRLIVIDFPKP